MIAFAGGMINPRALLASSFNSSFKRFFVFSAALVSCAVGNAQSIAIEDLLAIRPFNVQSTKNIAKFCEQISAAETKLADESNAIEQHYQSVTVHAKIGDEVKTLGTELDKFIEAYFSEEFFLRGQAIEGALHSAHQKNAEKIKKYFERAEALTTSTEEFAGRGNAEVQSKTNAGLRKIRRRGCEMNIAFLRFNFGDADRTLSSYNRTLALDAIQNTIIPDLHSDAGSERCAAHVRESHTRFVSQSRPEFVANALAFLKTKLIERPVRRALTNSERLGHLVVSLTVPANGQVDVDDANHHRTTLATSSAILEKFRAITEKYGEPLRVMRLLDGEQRATRGRANRLRDIKGSLAIQYDSLLREQEPSSTVVPENPCYKIY